MKKKISIKALSNSMVEVLIYDDIGDGWMGGISAKDFAGELKEFGEPEKINVRINSAGGSVFDGVAIYNTLLKHQAKIIVDVDGLAASIASIIMMAGDEINMADNALIMIHDPWTVAAGNADDLRDQADVLEKIGDTLVGTYVSRTGQETDKIKTMMADETWMSATEAKELGFVDNITEELKLAAHFDLSKFKNAPEDFIARTETPEENKGLKLKLARMEKTLKQYGL